MYAGAPLLPIHAEGSLLSLADCVVVAGEAELLQVVGATSCALAASRTFWTAGSSRPIRIAMMAMTTSNSISVKAGDDGRRSMESSRYRRGGNNLDTCPGVKMLQVIDLVATKIQNLIWMRGIGSTARRVRTTRNGRLV